MSLTLNAMLDGLRASRRFFHKHLKDLKPDQWDWKPYPECKSIRETLAHLIVDDKAALWSIETNSEPDYEGMLAQEPLGEVSELLARLETSFHNVLTAIETRYADTSLLDGEICIFGGQMNLARGIAYLSAEDYYHSGQVAYIRMASDPTWDYYASVYGEE